jgi:hypothetical protein
MEELGRLGFWLAAGIALAAWIISEGLKERTKERETQATLREMMRLEAEGKLTPETLAYMRARDPLAAAVVDLTKGGGKTSASEVALGVGVFSFFGGVLLGIMTLAVTKSWVVPVIVMPSAWAAGGLIALVIYLVFRKKDPPHGE